MTFTSGATEANNFVLLSWRAGGVSPPSERASGGVSPPLAIASHLEHPCVVEPLKQLEARGFAVEWLPVDSRGIIQFASLHPGAQLVCLMLANHETGAIQPVRDVALSLPSHVALHCDAAQAVGKIPVNFRELGVTTLTASAHKFGGPKSIGVLVAKRGAKLQPLMFGGHQERGRRPGTEPVALAVGMAAALEWCVRNMAANRAKLEALRERFWTRLNEVAEPVVLNGPEIGAAGRGADDAQRLVPRLPGRSLAHGARPRRRRLLDRLGLFERLASAQPGAARDGRAGRDPPLGAPLQLPPGAGIGPARRGRESCRRCGEKGAPFIAVRRIVSRPVFAP